MSAFNPLPLSRRLTPQEWQAIATDSLNTNSQFVVIGSILLGLVATSATAFPPTGIVIAGLGIYEAFRRNSNLRRNYTAINTYNCVAHVLRGDDLRDFSLQVGYEETARQIQWAIANEYAVSNDALDFFESPPKFVQTQQTLENTLPPPTIASSQRAPTIEYATPSQPSQSRVFAHTPTQVVPVQTQISNYAPPKSAEADLFEQMVGRQIRNQLFVGIQGAGKGILVSNALAAVKKYHPRRKVFVIDPKGKDEELGYWQGQADYLERAKILEMEPHSIVAWVKKCFESMPKSQATAFCF